MISGNYLENLKSTGFKLTAPRREVLGALSVTNPLSAQEVFDILIQKGFKADQVTVYRTLELFNKLGMVERIKFEDNTARYELISDKHHHHLICIKCGLVEEIEGDESELIKKITKKTDFKIERHSLEFFGFCKHCQM